MTKTPSSSSSPGKLLEAKILVAQAESKAKAKAKGKSMKVGTTKPAKYSSKASAAPKQPDPNEESSDLELVEDSSKVVSATTLLELQ